MSETAPELPPHLHYSAQVAKPELGMIWTDSGGHVCGQFRFTSMSYITFRSVAQIAEHIALLTELKARMEAEIARVAAAKPSEET